MNPALSTYIAAIQREHEHDEAREHAYRPALKSLLESLGNNFHAINDAARIKDVGAPDFIIKQDNIPVAFVEAKDIGIDLDGIERDDQMKRYLESLNNLVLTDYVEFRHYYKGERVEIARLGAVSGKQIVVDDAGLRAVDSLLGNFSLQQTPQVNSAEELAQYMAGMARQIARLIENTLPDSDSLKGQKSSFEETLIPNLSDRQFADMYAQTLAYGLFAARIPYTGDAKDFTLESAFFKLPPTNPFLRRLFQQIAPELDDRVKWLVQSLANLLAHADTSEILRGFGQRTRQDDPIVHFYETFLSRYDPKQRERRGVYYTPEPVVSYIVRSVDHILKTRFNRPDGLGDDNTLVLDPATGTGTFLYHVIQHIYETGNYARSAGEWDAYVSDTLLKRVFGFELLMAPYAVAHMKLGAYLEQTGYQFQSQERLGVYLTNTLEETVKGDQPNLPFTSFIAEEGKEATRVKRDEPIMVVLGNPPYSGISANNGDWITDLLKGILPNGKSSHNYYQVDGKPLNERKIWIKDDYVKFIRFAQWKIETTKYGVIAFVTNNSFLDSVTLRGMRHALLVAFDEIYVLNLHGSTKKLEKTPDGNQDDNVFDIQQGVSVTFFIKSDTSKSRLAKVHYFDLWGRRITKYDWLNSNHVKDTDWKLISPNQPYYFFVDKDESLQGEYLPYWSIPQILEEKSAGIQTSRDHFVTDFDSDKLLERISELVNDDVSTQALRSKFFKGKGSSKYPDGDTRGWKLVKAREILQNDANWKDRVIKYSYRPFDRRSLYYADHMIDWPRHDIMMHLQKDNLGLFITRQLASLPFDHVWVTNEISDQHIISVRTKEAGAVYPLYLYPDADKPTLFDNVDGDWSPGKDGRVPNLNPKFIKDMESRLGLTFISEPTTLTEQAKSPLPDASGRGLGGGVFTPEDVFHYAYAVFHSPTYRTRYAEFLKIDFPRLPLTSDVALFHALCEQGEKLVNLHLLKGIARSDFITTYPEKGDNVVLKSKHPRYDEKNRRIYINKTQYFQFNDTIDADTADMLWHFHIGGYQVPEKWLKDRRERELTGDDLTHYQRVLVALHHTDTIMTTIDDLIPTFPLP